MVNHFFNASSSIGKAKTLLNLDCQAILLRLATTLYFTKN